MARGEDNVGCCVDEDLHSKSKEALLHADATGVITWLRLVGESRAYSFWKKFSFPSNVRVSFPSSRPHYVDCMDKALGGMNSIYWPEIHISERLRFLFPP